jgi:hypothetical protein
VTRFDNSIANAVFVTPVSVSHGYFTVNQTVRTTKNNDQNENDTNNHRVLVLHSVQPHSPLNCSTSKVGLERSIEQTDCLSIYLYTQPIYLSIYLISTISQSIQDPPIDRLDCVPSPKIRSVTLNTLLRTVKPLTLP